MHYPRVHAVPTVPDVVRNLSLPPSTPPSLPLARSRSLCALARVSFARSPLCVTLATYLKPLRPKLIKNSPN
jgi:hypothetical protein